MQRFKINLASTKFLVLGAVLLALSIPAFQTISDPDFFWHIKEEQWILQNGFPHHDLFTYTVSQHPFITHEWLSEVIMSFLFFSIGSGAVVMFWGFVIWFGFLGILLTVDKKVPYIFIGITMVLGVAAGQAIWSPRTQRITFTFTVILLLLLRKYRTDLNRKWIYPLPLLFLIWVNAHGGFFLGLGILGLYLIGMSFLYRKDLRKIKAFLLIGISCFMVVLINPSFIWIYPYSIQTQFSSVQQSLIVEWASPNFHSGDVFFFEVMFLLLIVALIFNRRRIHFLDVLLLVVGIVLAFQSVRHIAIFVVIVTPILAELLGGIWETYKSHFPKYREPPRVKLIAIINCITLFLVFAVASSYLLPALRAPLESKEIKQNFPVDAITFMQHRKSPGNVFNVYHWGGYFVYRLWPAQKAYIYGDAAVLGDSFLKEFAGVDEVQPGYKAVLDKYKVNWILFQTDSPLVVVLSKDSEWGILYKDKVATILVRRSSVSSGYIPTKPYSSPVE